MKKNTNFSCFLVYYIIEPRYSLLPISLCHIANLKRHSGTVWGTQNLSRVSLWVYKHPRDVLGKNQNFRFCDDFSWFCVFADWADLLWCRCVSLYEAKMPMINRDMEPTCPRNFSNNSIMSWEHQGCKQSAQACHNVTFNRRLEFVVFFPLGPPI